MVELVQTVVVISAVLAALAILLGFILIKMSKNGQYIYYFPCVVLFVSGLVFLSIAPSMERMDIMGAGLGGWGIACLFGALSGFIITSINDVYARNE